MAVRVMRIGNPVFFQQQYPAFNVCLPLRSGVRHATQHVSPLQEFRVTRSVTIARIMGARGRRRTHLGSTTAAEDVTTPVINQTSKRSRPKLVKPLPPGKPFVLKKSGMNYPMVLSKELREFLGKEMMTRAEILTKLCLYVKENDMYAKRTRRFFVCDEAFTKLFGVTGEYRLLQLQTLIKPHLTPATAHGKEYEEKAESLFKKYLQERGAIHSVDVGRQKDPRGLNSLKAQKELHAKGLGMYAEIALSSHISTICDGKLKMSRPAILKSVWNYIKKNELQDPKKRRIVLLDDVLGEALQITDTKSIDCFALSKFVWKQTGSNVKQQVR